MKTNPNDPVCSIPGNLNEAAMLGITKREYFAALAMQAVLMTHGEDYPPRIAQKAVKYADSLIEELNEDTLWHQK